MPPVALTLLDDRLYGRQTNQQNLFTLLIPSLTIADFTAEFTLVRFTDIGEILLGFSNEGHSFVAYEYRGIESLMDKESVVTTHEGFWKLFKKKFEVRPGRHLEANFVLLSESGRHALVLSSHLGSDSVIYTVSLEKGEICDSYHINDDLFPDPGTTVNLYQDKLIFLVRSKQEFEILKLDPCGKLLFVDKIGEFACAADEKLVNMYPSCEGISALNHRMLVYWWQNAGSSPQAKLRNYFRQYNTIRDMKMSAFQFLDEDTLLIQHEVGPASSSSNIYFSIYNIPDSSIIAVYSDDDADLKRWLTDNMFDFILPTLTNTQASHANRKNYDVYREFIHSHLTMKDISGEARCSKFLPFSCQSLKISPFLNSELFHWNMQKLSPFGWLNSCIEDGCFNCTCSDNVIFIGKDGKSQFCLSDTNSAACALIFHPLEPLVIKKSFIDLNDSLTLNCKYHLYMYTPS